VSLHANHKHLTAERVAEIHAAGLRVLAYTVNDRARAKLLAQWGVDMICTDRIDMLAHDMLSTPENPA
jgi:glycerophosphoryl diester phosphodiesterase